MLGERSDLNLKPVSCSRQYGGGGLPPHHHNSFTALFRDHPGEPVPEENFWTLWCKGRSTEADTDHPAGRHSIGTNQYPPGGGGLVKSKLNTGNSDSELTSVLCVDVCLQRVTVVEKCCAAGGVIVDDERTLAQLRVIDDVTRCDVHRRLVETSSGRLHVVPSRGRGL